MTTSSMTMQVYTWKQTCDQIEKLHMPQTGQPFLPPLLTYFPMSTLSTLVHHRKNPEWSAEMLQGNAWRSWRKDVLRGYKVRGSSSLDSRPPQQMMSSSQNTQRREHTRHMSEYWSACLWAWTHDTPVPQPERSNHRAGRSKPHPGGEGNPYDRWRETCAVPWGPAGGWCPMFGVSLQGGCSWNMTLPRGVSVWPSLNQWGPGQQQADTQEVARV